MSVQDLDITCQVRGIVSKYWIDPHRLAFESRRGNVHVSGEVRVTGAEQCDEEIAAVLQSLENDIRRLSGVRELEFELTNWIRDANGEWSCAEKRAAAAQAQPLSAPSVEST
jgi:hypothetical protein